MTELTKIKWISTSIVLLLVLSVIFHLGCKEQDSSSEIEQARQILDASGVKGKLTEQNAALEGSKGGLLLVVSASDGKKVAEYKLESIPVWVGMAAANNRLYLATKNGRILCFAGND